MKRHAFAWVIFSTAVAFFLYEFIIRVFPAVMEPELRADFGLTAGAFGATIAFYYYAYAPMQIPVGILMDRYGARYLLTIAALVCALGCLLFGFGEEIWMLRIGRFLMGAGSAVGFVGYVYVASHWFPSNRLAFLVGFGNSIGMLGGILGEGPFAYPVHTFGWRPATLGLGTLGLLVAIILALAIRNQPRSTGSDISEVPTLRESAKSFLLVCKEPQIWLNAICGFFLFATINAFGGLWGVPFLQQAYGLSKQTAGFTATMTFLGLIAGGPIIGSLSDKVARRKSFLIASSLLGFISIIPVIYFLETPVWLVFGCLFLAGFFSGGQLLNFSFAIETMPRIAKGSATAVTNFIVMASGALIQPFVGLVLDAFWDGAMEGGRPIYDLETYQHAMSFFPLSFLIAALLALFLKERRHAEYTYVQG